MGASIREAVLWLQQEYVCLPGIRLTTRQVQRLLGMDASRCEAVLGALTDAGVLERTPEGEFVRRPLTARTANLAGRRRRAASRVAA